MGGEAPDVRAPVGTAGPCSYGLVAEAGAAFRVGITALRRAGRRPRIGG
ncbi:hypothetical protein SLNHY_4012 [Streptomyces albus]|nr:hypothetical protein SLNHY_4012 [Streptomyces albus]